MVIIIIGDGEEWTSLRPVNISEFGRISIKELQVQSLPTCSNGNSAQVLTHSFIPYCDPLHDHIDNVLKRFLFEEKIN